jgi:hypothetical protein
MLNLVTPLVLLAALALYVLFLRRFDRFKSKTMTAIGALLCAALIAINHFIALGPILAFGLYVAGLIAVYLTV